MLLADDGTSKYLRVPNHLHQTAIFVGIDVDATSEKAVVRDPYRAGRAFLRSP